MAGTAKDGSGRLAVIVPSSGLGEARKGPRRVVVLLDTSGSMAGEPMAMALRAVRACLSSLAEEDQFAVLAFADKVSGSSPTLVCADAKGREEAASFLAKVVFGGGTNLRAGIEAAATMLRASGGGEIFLITDGQVAGTAPIVRSTLATGIRVHCLGIGAASQDRFLAMLADATGGLSRMLDPGERIDGAAVDLFCGSGSPVADRVRVVACEDGQVVLAPNPPSSIFEGRPLIALGTFEGAMPKEVEVCWESPAGPRSLREPVTEVEAGAAETFKLLHGARLIASFEAVTAPNERDTLERLSRAYGLASRAMAWVAVVKRGNDDNSVLPVTRVVDLGGQLNRINWLKRQYGGVRRVTSGPQVKRKLDLGPDARDIVRYCRARDLTDDAASASPDDPEAIPLDLCSRIGADGGVEGQTLESRVVFSLALYLYLSHLDQGRSSRRFRRHLQRLEGFLTGDQVRKVDEGLRTLVEAVVVRLRSGRPIAGPWEAMCRPPLRKAPPKDTDTRKRLERTLSEALA